MYSVFNNQSNKSNQLNQSNQPDQLDLLAAQMGSTHLTPAQIQQRLGGPRPAFFEPETFSLGDGARTPSPYPDEQMITMAAQSSQYQQPNPVSPSHRVRGSVFFNFGANSGSIQPPVANQNNIQNNPLNHSPSSAFKKIT